MTLVHWILLAIVVVVVSGVYLYLRRQHGSDPWAGMEESQDTGEDPAGVSLNGDSYIVGVRTLSSDDAAAASGRGEGYSEATADAAWSAYKRDHDTAEAPQGTEQPAPEPAAPRPEPAPEPEPESEPEAQPSAPHASVRVDNIQPVRPPAGEEHVFMLHVASPDGRSFAGPDVHAALAAEGLKFGLNDFYHRVTDANGRIESVYCIANMLKPGVLIPEQQEQLATPGLTLFLVLPGAIDGVRAMRDMMETANGIAQRVGGQVLDDKRSLLKAQTAQFMLDEIAEIDRRARLQNTQQG